MHDKTLIKQVWSEYAHQKALTLREISHRNRTSLIAALEPLSDFSEAHQTNRIQSIGEKVIGCVLYDFLYLKALAKTTDEEFRREN